VLPDGRSWKYAWDHAGQLEAVTRPDGQRVTFSYDALGRRMKKTFAGKTTTYLWDGDELIHEIVEGTEPVTWVFEPGMFTPLAKVEGDKRYGIITDHLGTPTALLDEAGELAWKAQLDVFGVAHVDVMKTACPWRFPGQYEDEETGLYYNRFRYYDPLAGRYVSQDPIRLAGGDNLYGYVPDPLAWIDPLGLNCGRKGERIARRYLEGEGFNVLGSIQNRSGHGIDIVARDGVGALWFFEVKTTEGLVAPALSTAQALGAKSFVTDRLRRAARSAVAWAAIHDPNVAAKADALLREIRGVGVRGEVIRVTLGNGGISHTSW
jgi:RHS repeat-associated protein